LLPCVADCCVISMSIHVTVCNCHAELKGYYYYYYSVFLDVLM